MRTRIALFGQTAILSVCLVACQKEPTALNTNGPDAGLIQLSRGPLYEWKLEREAEGDKCPSSGSNCCKIQFLAGGTAEAVEQVLAALSTGDPHDISDAFAEHKVALNTFMASDDVDAVIELRLGARTSFNELEDADYIVITDESEDLRAYRVNLEL